MSDMVQERYARHWDMIDVLKLQTTPIKIIGAGSVGSFTAMSLVKMGAKMVEVWDDDMVDEVNISNQFYRIRDVGEYKVDALQSIINDFENVPIIANPTKKNNGLGLNGIVIVALDSMIPRKQIWDSIKDKSDVKLFIDPRMGGKVARIYSVNPINGVDKYESTLYSDDDSSEERCTEKTIIYNVNGIASFICKMVENYINNGVEGCSEIILDYESNTLMHSEL